MDMADMLPIVTDIATTINVLKEDTEKYRPIAQKPAVVEPIAIEEKSL